MSARKGPQEPPIQQAVVPAVPREVVRSQKHSVTARRDEWGNKPSTVRALVLRNGKDGAMGTGELVSSKIHISGREKLDLLAGM